MARRWHPGAKDDIGVFPKGSGTGQDPVRDEDVDPTAEALIPEALTALCPSARAVCRGGVSPRTPAQGSGSGALSRPPASPALCLLFLLPACGVRGGAQHPTPEASAPATPFFGGSVLRAEHTCDICDPACTATPTTESWASQGCLCSKHSAKGVQTEPAITSK